MTELKIDPKKVWLPIGTTIAIAAALIGGILSIQHELSEIKFELRSIRVENERSRETFRNWTLLLRAQNPTMNVPEFR